MARRTGFQLKYVPLLHLHLEPVILDGPKQGKGRRTHQYKVKALLKQEVSQKKYRAREEARKKSEATVV